MISIATFMEVLDISIANVALGHIAGSLSATYDEATWVLTSFLVANAIVIPICGWLADVIGRKRYYMISVALFTVSSLLCGLAPNLTFLILARVLQGIGGGGLAPVEQSMMVDTFPPAQRGMAFAAYGMVVIVGPILGPTLGGWITDNFSWHWVFLINVPVGMLSLFLVGMFVDEPPALEEAAPGEAEGWPEGRLGRLPAGGRQPRLPGGDARPRPARRLVLQPAHHLLRGRLGVRFIAIMPWELTRKDPIVDLRLLRQRNFAIANSC